MIIGINGKINSGKDTIGKIIQLIDMNSPKREIKEFVENNYNVVEPNWKIKKFADKLKDIVCLLIGCTREQLENRDFKEKELGEEWWYYDGYQFGANKLIPYNYTESKISKKFLIKLTPRKLFQLLGTECGRNIIHPNIWVNALFVDYQNNLQVIKSKAGVNGYIKEDKHNWIITDMRFPNELKAVKDRGGITIRVNRNIQKLFNGDKVITNKNENLKVVTSDNETKKCRLNDGNHYHFKGLILNNHFSETALDNHSFDYVIDNNGSISDLIDKVKEILISEKII